MLNLGKEIGVAVNETLKAVEDSAIRIADSNLGQTAITIVVWKFTLQRDSRCCNRYHITRNILVYATNW